ncbi:MAG: hypothetical protein ACRC0F_12145, partial [Cetobacterium sp.]
LIFDFYKFPEKSVQDDISLEDIILNSEKNIYVFSSHGHYDHFNSDIVNYPTLIEGGASWEVS